MRLIDAVALKAEIVDFKLNFRPQNQGYGSGYFSALSVVEGMLAYASTVDAVPVVRCKDCKQYNGHRHCTYFEQTVLDNDFCSYGERRNDDA